MTELPTSAGTPKGRDWLVEQWTAKVRYECNVFCRTPWAQNQRIGLSQYADKPTVFTLASQSRIVMVEVGADGHRGEFPIMVYVNGDEVQCSDVAATLRRVFEGANEDPLS